MPSVELALMWQGRKLSTYPARAVNITGGSIALYKPLSIADYRNGLEMVKPSSLDNK